MIDRAQALLTAPGTAAWVLWRLDGGIDHLLVDEAQDTSPAQWRVIEAISAEFFAGLGARAAERTIFVVGDEKQSIYSFQGADPAAFGDMRAHYERVIAGLGAELQRCDLLYSFRSARPILDLVDAVFRGAAGADLARRHHPPRHRPRGAPGRVELWPFLPKPDKAPESPWYEPLETPAPGDPVAALADPHRRPDRGAGCARAASCPAGTAPIRAGDVMILVQRRSPLFDADHPRAAGGGRAGRRRRRARDRHRRAGGGPARRLGPARGASGGGDAAATTSRWRRSCAARSAA